MHTEKIYLETYGCSHNQSDSETMAGLLKEEGYKVVNSAEDADLVIVNSCTVKNLAESKFFKRLKELEQQKKKIIAAGCVPQAERSYVDTKLKGFSIIGTTQISSIVNVARETLNDNRVVLLQKSHNPRLNLPKIRKNPIVEIIPINNGCLGSCTFCKTKFSRGHLLSFEVSEIKKQFENAVKDGCKEIWLTSEDTAVYGQDINSNIVWLLKELLETEGDYKIRLGMGNPDHFIKYQEELIEILNHPKMFKFLHIPMQAGSNRILGLMKRNYTKDEFLAIVKKVQKEIPEITIATDAICGFPTETEEEFQETIEVIKEIKPVVLNISRFWARPGTLAAGMEQIPGRITKERSSRLKEVFEELALEKNKEWVGWKGEVMVDEYGKNNTFVGRNYAYKPIIISGDYNIGEKINVEIKSATKYDLRA